MANVIRYWWKKRSTHENLEAFCVLSSRPLVTRICAVTWDIASSHASECLETRTVRTHEQSKYLTS